ncbi:MAG: isoleucine--tRNA ligase [Bacteroidota bacterium]|nr:isoleucine--tRNA ligase [Bacteroidota bacterium]
MIFKEYKDYETLDFSKEIQSFWDKNLIFKKSISERKSDKKFIFYEGPPSANGMPGIHHLMGRTIKDIFCRYKTLKGFQVQRKGGWDTHGLPVELDVEKELKITKEDIGKKISVKDYNDACRKAVMKYKDIWSNLTVKMGYWIDMNNPYVTYDTKYIESVWWILKNLYEKKLLYKGYSIQPYSPKAGTGLSTHELNQPGAYKDVTDTSITAQFEVDNSTLPPKLKKFSNLFFLAWTTTPWTLPSNTALSVNKKITYVVIKTFNRYTFSKINVVIAKDLITKQFVDIYFEIDNENKLDLFDPKINKKIPYYISDYFNGEDLIGIKYFKLWEESPDPLDSPFNAFRVIEGDFVTTDEGTGIVHTAPTFGADDALAAKRANPEVPPLLVIDENKNSVPLVDLSGKFRNEVGSLAGKYVKNEYYETSQIPDKSVDVEIAIKLKEQNKAFKVEKYVHSYPNCWRTDKPILYYPLDSWFIKVSKMSETLVEKNKKINWKPKSTGIGRFENWLKNANDWNLSRSRYWGIPLPIWRTLDRSETKVIGSIESLIYEIEKSIQWKFMDTNPFADFKIGEMSKSNYEKIDLHKHIVDDIILVSESGKKMIREQDLIDVWFDSGAMPYAQFHYPFENKDLIDKKTDFPADFICEGVDQTRGWFYTLHVISSLVSNSISYKNVISNGLVLDKNGQKMSKRIGNSIDPFKTLEKYGPDPTRWYMINNSNPWDNLKFNSDGIAEINRKYFGTLFNIYSFFSLYSNIDGFKFKEKSIPLNKRHELDQWILSELHKLIKEVDHSYNNYEPTKASRLITTYVQELLSNWYVRLSRRRFWKGEYNLDKISAFQTLFECLITILKISSPISPFFSERLYINLCENTKYEKFESVHLSNFPTYKEIYRNSDLEICMNKARIISSLVLSIRKKEKIKVRQPLSKILVPVINSKEKKSIERFQDIILSETNVKNIEIINEKNSILIKEVKPNFQKLGPKFGKIMKDIKNTLNKISKEKILELEERGFTTIYVNNRNIEISIEDVEISYKKIEGWIHTRGMGSTVALDINITDKLLLEGLSRDLINRIQNVRKEQGLDVTDKIIIYLKKNNLLETVLKQHEEFVMSETLSKKIIISDKNFNGTELNFEGVESEILIEKI